MSKIGIILASDDRSKAYIQKLVFSEKKLDKIILLSDKKIELDYSENEIEISKNMVLIYQSRLRNFCKKEKYLLKNLISWILTIQN